MGQLEKERTCILGMLELGSVGMVAVCLVHKLHWATGQQLLIWMVKFTYCKCDPNWLVHCYPALLINCVMLKNITGEPFKRATYRGEYKIKCCLIITFRSASASQDSGKSESLLHCNGSLD